MNYRTIKIRNAKYVILENPVMTYFLYLSKEDWFIIAGYVMSSDICYRAENKVIGYVLYWFSHSQ